MPQWTKLYPSTSTRSTRDPRTCSGAPHPSLEEGSLTLIQCSFLPGLELGFYCHPQCFQRYSAIMVIVLLVGIWLVTLQVRPLTSPTLSSASIVGPVPLLAETAAADTGACHVPQVPHVSCVYNHARSSSSRLLHSDWCQRRTLCYCTEFTGQS